MHDDVLKLVNLPQDVSQEITHMETLITTMQAAPAAADRMREHGIPEKIITDTFADIGLWAARCKRQLGHWGLADPSPSWLPNHLDCKIFRVGRFQCIPKLFEADKNVRFFRNNETGKVQAITAGDTLFRSDGQISGTGKIFADENGFRGFYREENGIVQGLAVDPAGFVRNEEITLCMNQWTETLKNDTPILELHIPVDGDFDMETCRTSLIEMAEFVKTHEKAIAELTGINGPFVAFTLSSWLLDAQLDGILPPTSRLVQHLRQYYLIPVLVEGYNSTFWIFAGRQLEAKDIPQDEIKTSLQRSLVDFMLGGGRTRHNFGIIMLDDIHKFGTEIYRR